MVNFLAHHTNGCQFWGQNGLSYPSNHGNLLYRGGTMLVMHLQQDVGPLGMRFPSFTIKFITFLPHGGRGAPFMLPIIFFILVVSSPPPFLFIFWGGVGWGEGVTLHVYASSTTHKVCRSDWNAVLILTIKMITFLPHGGGGRLLC